MYIRPIWYILAFLGSAFIRLPKRLIHRCRCWQHRYRGRTVKTYGELILPRAMARPRLMKQANDPGHGDEPNQTGLNMTFKYPYAPRRDGT